MCVYSYLYLKANASAASPRMWGTKAFDIEVDGFINENLTLGLQKIIENLTQILPKMVPKSMKIEVWGGLGGSGGRLGSSLEPRWRPRAARGGPRGAKMANLAPTWANLARKWGPKSIENRWKIDQKIVKFFWLFFEEVLEGIGTKNRSKIDAKMDAKMIKETNRRKMLKKWNTFKNHNIF